MSAVLRFFKKPAVTHALAAAFAVAAASLASGRLDLSPLLNVFATPAPSQAAP